MIVFARKINGSLENAIVDFVDKQDTTALFKLEGEAINKNIFGQKVVQTLNDWIYKITGQLKTDLHKDDRRLIGDMLDNEMKALLKYKDHLKTNYKIALSAAALVGVGVLGLWSYLKAKPTDNFYA